MRCGPRMQGFPIARQLLHAVAILLRCNLKNRKLVIDKPLDSPRNRRYFVFSSLTYYARRGHSATVQNDQYWWSARPKDIHGGKWDL